jgi:outer membrane protein TolC
LTLGAMFCLGLTACGVAPPAPRPLAPQAELARTAFAAREIDPPGFAEFARARGYNGPWPIERWGQVELLLYAAYDHPRLRVARARDEAARREIELSGQQGHNELRLLTEHHARAPGGVSPWSIAVEWLASLGRGELIAARRDQAQLTLRRSEMGRARTLWELRAAITRNYTAIAAAEARQQWLEQEAQVHNDMVNVAQRRLDLGYGSSADLMLAEQARNAAEQLLAETKGAAEGARSRLAEAVGLPRQRLTKLTLAFDATPPPAPPPLAELERRALTNRLDLELAALDYAEVEAELRVVAARAGLAVALGPSYGWDEGRNRWGIGIELSWPGSARSEAELAAVLARRDAAAAAFSAQQIAIVGALGAQLAELTAGLTQLDLAANAATQAEQALRQVEARLDSGEADRVEVNRARLAWLAAARARVDAAERQRERLAALEDAMQAPLRPEPYALFGNARGDAAFAAE